jgi:hypothetical protein
MELSDNDNNDDNTVAVATLTAQANFLLREILIVDRKICTIM